MKEDIVNGFIFIGIPILFGILLFIDLYRDKQPTGCNCTVAIETLEAARDRLVECRFALDYVELQTMRRDVGKDDLPKAFNRVRR